MPPAYDLDPWTNADLPWTPGQSCESGGCEDVAVS